MGKLNHLIILMIFILNGCTPSNQACGPIPSIDKDVWNVVVDLKLPLYKGLAMFEFEAQVKKDIIQLFDISKETVDLIFVQYFACRTAVAVKMDPIASEKHITNIIGFYERHLENLKADRFRKSIQENQKRIETERKAEKAWAELEAEINSMAK